ncbi:MAG: M1 family metallopeptidase [Actinomycetales bacterium]|nr:M1 family metallopeptidase [Actinomycetales bacterium]
MVDEAGDCLSLPFRGERFDASSAQIDGAPARSARHADEVLTVCGPGHHAGDTLTLAVDVVVPLQTVSASQVGYSITLDRDRNPFYYLVSWVGGCDRFGPCDNRPDQFATYTFRVTHPAELMVACPGTITKLSETETRCEFTHDGGPTYSTFGVGAYPAAAWVPTDMGMWGSARVTVYDRPGNGLAEALDPAHHAAFVRWLEERFGPYPFGDELRVLTAPTYWNGFEHPGNIVLDDGLHRVLRPSYLRNAQHVLDHEIAHQWAGDETTLADTYDFVWKEAMAEYLTFAFEASTEEAAAIRTLSAWKSFSRGAAYFPVPAERPPLFDYYGDVYGPGPMILFRQIEALSSRDQVLAALATLLGEPRAISVDDVLAALETSTGLDLGAYAAAWIHGTGAPVWPTASVTYTPGAAETSTLAVRITSAPERRCKFHVALRGEAAEDVVNVAVDTFRDGPEQTLAIATPPFVVTSTLLDPLAECLVYPGTATRTERRHPWRSERALGHAPLP